MQHSTSQGRARAERRVTAEPACTLSGDRPTHSSDAGRA